MAARHASQVPQEVENIQAQVAQLRSTLRELGQTLLEWGQRGVDDTRQELQAHAQALGDTIHDTVEGARKRSRHPVPTTQPTRGPACVPR
jgi:flagellar biosynthesis chaperone FliJ